MQQGPSSNQMFGDLQTALAPLVRQLERMEERTRDLVTRGDLEALRKEVVARDLLEPQLGLLRSQISRLESDRIADKKDLEKQIDDLQKEQASRAERFWMRAGPVIAAFALILSLLEFISHFKFLP